jgi:hypothetical protein
MQAQAEIAEARAYAQQQAGDNKTKPPRPPQVQDALRTLDFSIDENLKLCSELESRLSEAGVLRPEEAGKSGPPTLAEDSGPTAPMANRIGEIAARSRSLSRSYKSMLQRLEL